MLGEGAGAQMFALKALDWGTKRISQEMGVSRSTVRGWLRAGVDVGLRMVEQALRPFRRSLGRKAIEAGHGCRFVHAADLTHQPIAASRHGALEEAITLFGRPRLLIIDELGNLPLEREAGHRLFHLIRRRYEKGRLMLASNQLSIMGRPKAASGLAGSPGDQPATQTSGGTGWLRKWVMPSFRP